jgi:hypothetical protein
VGNLNGVLKSQVVLTIAVFIGKNRNLLSKLLIVFFFLVFSFIVLRGTFFSSGFIGFNHDWNFPMTSLALKSFCTQSLFLWNNQYGGYGLIYPAENLYRFLLFPFSFLGFSGLQVIDLILLCAFTFGGFFMYLLLRESFGLRFIPSVISSLFYITTPVIFNKVVSGQVPYFIAYAMSPLIIFCFIKYIRNLKASYLIVTALLLAFATIQIQFGVMLSLLMFFYAIFLAKIRLIFLFKMFLSVFIISFLIHSFWLIPDIFNSFSSVTSTLSGASNVSNLAGWGTSISNALRMIGYRSPHFETLLSNYSYKSAWDLFSFIIVISAFSAILFSNKRVPLFFAIVSVITLIFTTVNGPFSFVVYYLYSKFPIFNLFREVYHLSFLIAFSYSIMLAFFLTTIMNSKKLTKYLKMTIVMVLIIAVLMNNPFIYSGNFGGQIQKYDLNANNLSIIDHYLNSSEDFRVLYLPMVQPLKFDNLTYNGVDPIITYSSKPTIGNYMLSDFQNHFAITFYLPSSNLTSLLSILSIKYVFLRNDTQSMLPSYLTEEGLPLGNGYYDIRPIWTNENLLKTMVTQQTLILSENSDGLMVFKNNYYLPHIYSTTIPIVVNGSMDELFSSLQTNNISNINTEAMFLSQQLSQNQRQFINDNKNSGIEKQISSPELTFKTINPTKYEVQVENATGPFFLVFNENFDSEWKAFLVDNCNYSSIVPIPEGKHFIANGYANSWYIDPQQLSGGAEQFTITLNYTPQNYYDLGLIISGITFAVSICYLTYRLKPAILRIWKQFMSYTPG